MIPKLSLSGFQPLISFKQVHHFQILAVLIVLIFPRRRTSNVFSPVLAAGNMTLSDQPPYVCDLIRVTGATGRILLSAGASVLPPRSGFA